MFSSSEKKKKFVILKSEIIDIWQSKCNFNYYYIQLECNVTKSFNESKLKIVDFLYPVTPGEKEEIYDNRSIKLFIDEKNKQYLIDIFCTKTIKIKTFKLDNCDFIFKICKNSVDIIDNFCKIKYKINNFQKIFNII